MATKSVIEIDILDQKFQEFAEEFERIKKALGEMPAEWQKAFEPAEKGAKATSKEIENATKKRKDYNKALQDGNKALSQTEKSTGNIARNMADTVLSATKWLGLSSLISIGGLTALARSVSSERTQGLGINVPTGQLRAAKNIYGQLFDIESDLENIAAARRDPYKSTMLERIPGINTANQNPLEIYEKLMPALIRQFSQYQGAGLSTLDLAYKSSGLSGIIPVEELYKQLNLEKEKPGSFEELTRQREQKTGLFTTGAATDEKWQQFVIALDNLTTLLKVNLVNGLTPLEPLLTKLNQNLTEIINSIAPALQKLITIFGWVEDTRKKWGIKLPHEYILENLPENERVLKSGWEATKNFFSTGLLNEIGKKQSETLKEASNHFGLTVPLNKITNKVTDAIDDLNKKLDKVDKKNGSVSFEQLLEKTKADYKTAYGKDLPITSMSRSRTEQQDLYNRWLKGEPGIYKPLNPADYPNRQMFHENQIDVSREVPRDFMLKEGWKGGEPSDPVHYKLPKDTNVSVNSRLNIYDYTGGNIFYQSSAMQVVT